MFLQEAAGQKLPIQNFNVDRGLIQSQVSSITQDAERYLWVGTYGGLDRFDGTSFKHFTRAEGINSSSIICLYTAVNGNIWAGTFKGLTCYDGYKVKNFTFNDTLSSFNWRTITEDNTGTIWALNFTKGLFAFRNNEFVKCDPPVPRAIPTSICKRNDGQLLAYFYKTGFFIYQTGNWKKIFDYTLPDHEFIMLLKPKDKIYYGITNKGRLVKFSEKEMIAEHALENDAISTLCIDRKGNLWTGTNKGIYVFNGDNLSLIATYNKSSGLSDNLVTAIYEDVEENMWVGTDGGGLFKVSDGPFVKYDNTNGLQDNVVMGIAEDANHNLYLGTRGGGLSKCNILTNKISQLDYSLVDNSGINSLAVDNHNNVLFSTMNGRLIQYNGYDFKTIPLDGTKHFSINSIVVDGARTWLATVAGCYYLEENKSVKVKGIDEVAWSFIRISDSEMLVGTIKGIYSIHGDQAKKIDIPQLRGADVNCFARFHDFIIIGTNDNGVYYWNRNSGELYSCDTKQGLADDHVFSLFIDNKSVVWIGTGTRIQQVTFNQKDHSFFVRKFSIAEGYENAESNLNAIHEDTYGNIWIGTTKGAFVYKNESIAPTIYKPFISIQEVSSSLDSSEISSNETSRWSHLAISPVLPYNKNNISFTIKGILLKSPESLQYSYQLVGYDKEFSVPVNQTFFNYQSLKPGQYIFRAKVISQEGTASGNIAEYPFSVSTPFYQKTWFVFLMIIGLVLTGIMIQLFISKLVLRKKRQIEKVRLEEQLRIKERTAEDFHDELGNKIARIGLLADILQKKTAIDDKDKINIIKQLRENVSALYTGTKDILWSLSPGNDSFLELVDKIEQFGEELFAESGISFMMKKPAVIDSALAIPAEYSRNIIMIFKETMSNSLRHSGCSQVEVEIVLRSNNKVFISQFDNGQGFDNQQIKRGNGLNNIERRAARIGAVISNPSISKPGSLITLTFTIP